MQFLTGRSWCLMSIRYDKLRVLDGTVFLFYLFKDTKHFIRTGVGVAFLALTRTMGYYCTTGLSIIP